MKLGRLWEWKSFSVSSQFDSEWHKYCKRWHRAPERPGTASVYVFVKWVQEQCDCNNNNNNNNCTTYTVIYIRLRCRVIAAHTIHHHLNTGTRFHWHQFILQMGLIGWDMWGMMASSIFNKSPLSTTPHSWYEASTGNGLKCNLQPECAACSYTEDNKQQAVTS